jgi:hypothetical protein
MNTIKKIFYNIFTKYAGIIYSLILILSIKINPIRSASTAFLISMLISSNIIYELVVMRKSTINKSRLLCILVLNFILTIAITIAYLLNPSNEANQYLYVTWVMAIILIVTLPISYWMLYTEKEKAK